MSKDDTHSVPEDGRTAFETEDHPRPDDDIRRQAAARLAEHLDLGADLIARCEMLSAQGKGKGDRLGPIHAAARLMRANAEVAKALAGMVQVEHRRRTIVEHLEPVDRKAAELNSKFREEQIDAEQRLKIFRRMNEIVEESIRARQGDDSVSDRAAELVRETEDEIADFARLAEGRDD